MARAPPRPARARASVADEGADGLASSASSPAATRTPQVAGTTLGRPPTAVATTGRPLAIASGTASGRPSVRDDSAKRSNEASNDGMSRRTPVSVT